MKPVLSRSLLPRLSAPRPGRVARSIRFTAAMFLMLAGAAITTAHAVEFRSVGSNPVVLYDAPSEKGRKVFVAPRNMPVEVVLTYGEWSKVRDVSGDLAWVETRALVPKRHVVANAAATKIRAASEDSAAVLFTVDKGVLFELAEPVSSGWIKVRHRDGQTGFVKASEVWGE